MAAHQCYLKWAILNQKLSLHLFSHSFKFSFHLFTFDFFQCNVVAVSHV